MTLADRYTGMEKLWGRWGLYLALLCACIIRLFLLWTHGSIVMDGVLYMQLARAVADGKWGEAFNATVFNAFPVMIAAVYRVGNPLFSFTLEDAALFITSVSGILVIVPFYALARMAFGRIAAAVTALYVAINPALAQYSCDVLREAPFLFFSATGVALFVYALQESDPRRWRIGHIFGAALAIFIAGLIRFEAFGWFAVMGIALLCVHVRKGRSYALRARMRSIFIAGVMGVCIAALVIVGVRLQTGEWHFARADKVFSSWSLGSLDTRIRDVVNITVPVTYTANDVVSRDVYVQQRFISLAREHMWALSVVEIAITTGKALHPIGIALVFLGLFFCVRDRRISILSPSGVVMAAGFLLFSAVFVRYTMVQFYFSTRHAITYMLLAAPFVGVPVLYAYRRVPWSVYITLVCVVVSFVLLFGRAMRPIRRDKLPFKQYGHMLREILPEDAVIVGQGKLRPVGYYAEREFITGDLFAPARVRRIVSRQETAYVLVNRYAGGEAFIAPMTDIVERVHHTFPATEKYSFALYRYRGHENDE